MRYIRHCEGLRDVVYTSEEEEEITHNSYERRKEDGVIDALKKYYKRKDTSYTENDKKLISLKNNKKIPSAGEIITEVASKKEPIKKVNKKISKAKGIVLISLILLCAFFIYLLLLDIPTKIGVIMSETEKTRFENITLTNNLPLEIYFYNITKNLSAYNNKNLTLKGFLEQRLEERGSGGGVYVNYIVDDNGNSIKLLFKANKTALKNEFFNGLGESKELYQVSGTFTMGLEEGLQVNTISLSQREFIESTYQETREINYTEKLSFFDKIRLIAKKSKYLFSFTCEDGTPWNNCSINQPDFCIANRIIEKPEKCGCPNNKRIYENTCIPI